MAFQLPTFNLLANLWGTVGWDVTIPIPPAGAPRVALVPCNLAFGRRSMVGGTGGGNDPLTVYNFSGGQLLFPAGTDVRGINSYPPDTVECPAGSGEWWIVQWVYDSGKGFPNEHRVAVVMPIVYSWTPPYP